MNVELENLLQVGANEQKKFCLMVGRKKDPKNMTFTLLIIPPASGTVIEFT